MQSANCPRLAPMSTTVPSSSASIIWSCSVDAKTLARNNAARYSRIHRVRMILIMIFTGSGILFRTTRNKKVVVKSIAVGDGGFQLRTIQNKCVVTKGTTELHRCLRVRVRMQPSKDFAENYWFVSDNKLSHPA